MFDMHLHFTVDTKLEKIIIKVVDTATDKVIKQIPSEAAQDFLYALKKSYGILVDKKA